MPITVTNVTATSAVGGLKMYLGKMTGVWAGDVAGKASVTVPLGEVCFVYIPPVSGYQFQVDVSSLTSNFAVMGGGASNAVLSSITYSVDLSSFNCVFNSTATVGVPFIAFGY
jgi:hypothetical protein